MDFGPSNWVFLILSGPNNRPFRTSTSHKVILLLTFLNFSETLEKKLKSKKMATGMKLPMAISLQKPMAMASQSSSSSLARGTNFRTVCCTNATSKAKIPLPPINPKDPFLSKLASVASTSPETLLNRPSNSDSPPYLDLFDAPQLMAAPAQVS